MYKKSLHPTTSLNVNTSYQGETIEEKVKRILNNKEPINDTTPIIYTDRKDGVNPAHDIRTDRFEIAIEAMDKVAQAQIDIRAKRHEPEKPTETENGGTPANPSDSGPIIPK